jgi:predicted N-formylglutamate amidohydrolase
MSLIGYRPYHNLEHALWLCRVPTNLAPQILLFHFFTSFYPVSKREFHITQEVKIRRHGNVSTLFDRIPNPKANIKV